MPYPPLRGYFGGAPQIFDLSRAIPAEGRDNFAEGKVTFPLTWGSMGDREAGKPSRHTAICRNLIADIRSGGVYAATFSRRTRTDGAVDGAATHWAETV